MSGSSKDPTEEAINAAIADAGYKSALDWAADTTITPEEDRKLRERLSARFPELNIDWDFVDRCSKDPGMMAATEELHRQFGRFAGGIHSGLGDKDFDEALLNHARVSIAVGKRCAQ